MVLAYQILLYPNPTSSLAVVKSRQVPGTCLLKRQVPGTGVFGTGLLLVPFAKPKERGGRMK